MTDTIVFYTNPMSRGRIVHWMLEEIGAPYRTELLNFDRYEQKAPAFLAINPMGKVPTIVHRGVVVTEAAAICTYLADAFPKAGLAPAFNDPARGTYLRWMFFGAACIESAIIDRIFERPASVPSMSLGYGGCDATSNALAKAVTPGPFVLGERFSAVDVYLASQISWGLGTKALEARPAFERYSARCTDRQGLERFIAASPMPT